MEGDYVYHLSNRLNKEMKETDERIKKLENEIRELKKELALLILRVTTERKK